MEFTAYEGLEVREMCGMLGTESNFNRENISDDGGKGTALMGAGLAAKDLFGPSAEGKKFSAVITGGCLRSSDSFLEPFNRR